MIRVLIVDDDPLVRQALVLMLGGQADIEVVGEVDDGTRVTRAVQELAPTVVLMDIRMPRRTGLEATLDLRAAPAAPHVIVLTTFDADEYVVQALAAGADGFLLKDSEPAEIVSAIRKVADGETMLSPSATKTLVRRIREGAADDRTAMAEARMASLTDRERDVALEVGRGLSNAEIAGRLHLAVPTVKSYVSKLFDKLEASNRVQVAICVHDAGLLD